MPVEPFDVTDENGVRVTGTAEAYRDRNGPYYDPNSSYYHNPRNSDHDINYLNTRDVCRINPSALSTAVQEAFRAALIRLGMPKPSGPAVENDVNKWISETLRQCALHPDKYVANQPPSSVGLSSGKQEASSLPAAFNSGARPMNTASRQQQQNAGQPQSSVFDTGAASLPFIPTTALASSGDEPLADNAAQEKALIRRLTRVRAG